MGKLFDVATQRRSLMSAWKRIRTNGANSASSETRSAIARFEQDESGNIHRIQRRLRDGTFEFDPQKGILKRKSSGAKRGIVMASVQNRVVERALLERMQDDIPYIRSVIATPTSVGGVPNRSVPHGLKVIQQCINDGKKHFVRSDISAFFDNIPRGLILAALSEHIRDDAFRDLLDRASSVTLGNEKALGDDRGLFPVDNHGVAQGSPLSPLFGNILLSNFDKVMNDRGVVCVRFIDDFVILAESEAKVRKAFHSGVKLLKDLGLRCHDPFEDGSNLEKSERGIVENGFVFLGYKIEPGLYQPSVRSRKKLLGALDECFRDGRYGIKECLRYGDSFVNRQRYAQTLDVADRILRGWGNSFAYSNSARTMDDLDVKVDEKIEVFRKWFAVQMRSLDRQDRRRAGGVCLLTDVAMKSLDEVPFVIESSTKGFRTSSKTLNISTDGSVIAHGNRKGKDQGPGGWGFIVHETDQRMSGNQEQTTNNAMELRAVIEAVGRQPKDRTLKIHTDSQYVSKGINGKNPVKSNLELWKQLEYLLLNRAPVKVVWVKAHVGNKHNEIADQLANSAAQALKSKADRSFQSLLPR